MKTLVKFSDVRNEFKQVKAQTICGCISTIYALFQEFKDNQKNLDKEAQTELNTLKKVLPATKAKAKEHCKQIAEFGKVGETKTITRKDGTTYERVIKPSCDMILRYFVQEYNKSVPEDKQEIKKTSK